MLLPIVAGGPGDQFNQNSNQQGHPLGNLMSFADGRRYKYGQAASTEIAAAMLCQQTINNANRDELAVAAAVAVGSKTITVTNGSAAIGLDDLADGFVNIEDDAGEGHVYTIKSNNVAAGAAVVTLQLYDPVQVALTTASTVVLFINPYSLVIVHPSPATALLVGVTPLIISASNFGWFQITGPASVLGGTATTALVINELAMDHLTVDGAVNGTLLVEGTPNVGGGWHTVGIVMEVAADGEHSLINLGMT